MGILDDAADRGATVDISKLHVLLTLDFIGEVGLGTELHALDDGDDCEILGIFHDVLPEMMKCGLFPLRAKIPLLESTRRMHRGIKRLRQMGHDAVKQVRDSTLEKSPSSKRIFEILAQYVFRDLRFSRHSKRSYRERDTEGRYVFSSEELVDNYGEFSSTGITSLVTLRSI